MLKLTAQEMATKVIAAVQSDMAAGWVPATVDTFSALHDHVDANMYLLNEMEEAGEEYDPASDEQSSRDNAAMELVNQWLANR